MVKIKCGHDVYMVWECDIYEDIENAFKYLMKSVTSKK